MPEMNDTHHQIPQPGTPQPAHGQPTYATNVHPGGQAPPHPQAPAPGYGTPPSQPGLTPSAPGGLTPPMPGHKPSSGRTGLIVGLIVGAMVLAAIAFFLFGGRVSIGGDDTPTPTSDVVPDQQTGDTPQTETPPPMDQTPTQPPPQTGGLVDLIPAEVDTEVGTYTTQEAVIDETAVSQGALEGYLVTYRAPTGGQVEMSAAAFSSPGVASQLQGEVVNVLVNDEGLERVEEVNTGDLNATLLVTPDNAVEAVVWSNGPVYAIVVGPTGAAVPLYNSLPF